MALDTSIILGYKQPQIMSADDRMAKQLQLKALLSQQQENDLKMQAYKDQRDEDLMFKNALRNNPKITEEQLLGMGLSNQAASLGKQRRESAKAQTELDASNLKLMHDKADYFGSTAGAVVNNPTYENATYAIKDSLARGYISPEQAQSALGSLSQDPNQIRQQFQGYLTSALSAKDQLPEIKVVDNGGSNQIVSINKATQQPTVTGTYAKTQSPDNVATNERTVSEGRLNRANAINVAKIKEQGNDILVNGISPEAIDAAAARYRIDGTLPPLGMGKAAAQLRTQILNKAAGLDANDGITGEDARITQIGGKATTSGIAQLEKQKTMVSAFEKNAKLNSQMALDLSEKVDRTGIPILNQWIQAGQKNVTGNPEVSKFHAANETFVNEYAKIMSGSMGNTAVSDSARQHAHSLLETAHTKEQYKAVMQTLNAEMDNRMRGFDDQLKESRDSLRHSTKTTPSANLPPVNRKGWALHVDAQGNKAYVSPNGQEYDEVK